MLLPYTSFGSEDTVLTVALALPAIAAVAVDRVLRRSRGSRGSRGSRRSRAVGEREDRPLHAAAGAVRPPAASPRRR